MLYVIEVGYEKDKLPLLDIWDFIELYDIQDAETYHKNINLKIAGELFRFDNFDLFKEWYEQEYIEDPIFLVIDTEKREVYYYEVYPEVRFNKLTGVMTLSEIEEANEKLLLELEKNREKYDIERKERERQLLLDDKARLEEKLKIIEGQLNENQTMQE